MNKPRLENWRVVLDAQIVGHVYDDPRFPDGTPVVTSRVVEWNKATGEVRTKNTNYLLGRRADDSGAV